MEGVCGTLLKLDGVCALLAVRLVVSRNPILYSEIHTRQLSVSHLFACNLYAVTGVYYLEFLDYVVLYSVAS